MTQVQVKVDVPWQAYIGCGESTSCGLFCLIYKIEACAELEVVITFETTTETKLAKSPEIIGRVLDHTVLKKMIHGMECDNRFRQIILENATPKSELTCTCNRKIISIHRRGAQEAACISSTPISMTFNRILFTLKHLGSFVH